MKLKYRDVTRDWLKNSCPNSHRLKTRNYYEHDGIRYFVVGKKVVFDYTNYEKDIAVWLENSFGGKIYLLPKVNELKGIKTADYLFHNEYCDLKKMSCNVISEKRAVDNVVKKSKFQTENIILDISNSILNDNIILQQVKRLYSTGWIKHVLIVKNFNLIKVLLENKNEAVPLQTEWERPQM